MPTYTFKCTCGNQTELFLRISELERKRPTCHGPMETVIQPVHGHVQMECRYRCPATGIGVTNWKQRKEIFAEHRLQDASDTTAEQTIAKANKKQAELSARAAKMPGSYSDVYK